MGEGVQLDAALEIDAEQSEPVGMVGEHQMSESLGEEDALAAPGHAADQEVGEGGQVSPEPAAMALPQPDHQPSRWRRGLVEAEEGHVVGDRGAEHLHDQTPVLDPADDLGVGGLLDGLLAVEDVAQGDPGWQPPCETGIVARDLPPAGAAEALDRPPWGVVNQPELTGDPSHPRRKAEQVPVGGDPHRGQAAADDQGDLRRRGAERQDGQERQGQQDREAHRVAQKPQQDRAHPEPVPGLAGAGGRTRSHGRGSAPRRHEGAGVEGLDQRLEQGQQRTPAPELDGKKDDDDRHQGATALVVAGEHLRHGDHEADGEEDVDEGEADLAQPGEKGGHHFPALPAGATGAASVRGWVR